MKKTAKAATFNRAAALKSDAIALAVCCFGFVIILATFTFLATSNALAKPAPQSQSSSGDGDLEQPVELGNVHWNRDLDDAAANAERQNKPIAILFQEVPG